MNKEIIELREVITKLVPMLAGKKIVVTQRGSTAQVFTDPKTRKPIRVNIPSIPDNAAPDFVRAIQGFIDHEIGHVLLTDWSIYGNGVTPEQAERDPKKKRIVDLHNIWEDTMIEREMAKIFPGSRKNVSDLRKHFLEKVTKKALATAEGDEKKQFEYLLVPAARALAGHTEFQEFMDDGGYWKNPYVQNLVASLKPETLKTLPKLTSTRQTLAVAQEVESILYPAQQQPPEPEEDDQDGDDGKGKGKKPHTKDSKNASGGEGDEDGNPDDADGSSGKGSKGGGSKKNSKGKKGQDEKDKSEAEDADDDGEKSSPDEAGESDEDKDGDQGEPDENDGSDDSEKEDQGDDTEGDGDESDEEADGDNAGDDEDDGDADGDGADGDADEDEGDEGDEDGEGNVVETVNDDDHDAVSQSGGSNDSGGGGVGNGSGKAMFDLDPDALDQADLSKQVSILLTKEAIDAIGEGDYTVYSREHDRIEPLPVPATIQKDWVPNLEDEVRSMTGKMAKDIERMMAARSLSVRVAGNRSGRLHAPSLHRVLAGDDRVFSRKHEHKSKETAVTLLCDNSGSMSGAKVRTAMVAAYALASTLERVNVVNELLGFTTGDASGGNAFYQEMYEDQRKTGVQYNRTSPIVMPIYKTFDERINSTVKSRIAYMANAQPGMYANVDGESLEYAAIRLMKRREARKVLIVLSDGAPSGARDASGHLKATVKKLSKIGIDVVGIGIQDANVRHYYEKHVVLNNVADLPGQIMKQLHGILAA